MGFLSAILWVFTGIFNDLHTHSEVCSSAVKEQGKREKMESGLCPGNTESTRMPENFTATCLVSLFIGPSYTFEDYSYPKLFSKPCISYLNRKRST